MIIFKKGWSNISLLSMGCVFIGMRCINSIGFDTLYTTWKSFILESFSSISSIGDLDCQVAFIQIYAIIRYRKVQRALPVMVVITIIRCTFWISTVADIISLVFSSYTTELASFSCYHTFCHRNCRSIHVLHTVSNIEIILILHTDFPTDCYRFKWEL